MSPSQPICFATAESHKTAQQALRVWQLNYKMINTDFNVEEFIFISGIWALCTLLLFNSPWCGLRAKLVLIYDIRGKPQWLTGSVEENQLEKNIQGSVQ
jgi:hypothetical protein